ncbi:MAG: stalk domain-containing protein [Caldisericia bacterium]
MARVSHALEQFSIHLSADAPISDCGAGAMGGELPEWVRPEPKIDEIPELPGALKVEPNFISSHVDSTFELAVINGVEPFKFEVVDESVCKLVSQEGHKATFKVTGTEATIINVSDSSNQIRQIWVTVPKAIFDPTELTASPSILPVRVGHEGLFRICSDIAPQVKILPGKAIDVENLGDSLKIYAKKSGVESITLTAGEWEVTLKILCYADGKTETSDIFEFRSAPGDGKVRLSWKHPTMQTSPYEGVIITMNGTEITRTSADVAGYTVTGLKNYTKYEFAITQIGKDNKLTSSCTPGPLEQTIVLWIGKNNAVVNGNAATIDTNSSVVPKVIGEGHTVIPFRFLAESLGAEVGWNGTLREVSFITPSSYLKVYIDKTVGYMWDSQVIINPAPSIVGGRTLIPLRAVSELLGADVGWDGKEKKITIKYVRPWYGW